MELQTVSNVSKTLGISAQMLRYYERSGLIKSLRKDDYAYRVYDDENIKRLQQILILRKLQIPMKQIKAILNNQNAAEVIDIFKQNMDELDEQITALSTVRAILKRFVDELHEKANVQLKLDLLNDKSMISLVAALSLSENKIKEKISMDELNQASKTLSKRADRFYGGRIVHLPSMTWAFAAGADCRDVLKKFIDDVDLFNIKPDARVFGFNAFGKENNADAFFTSIPDNLEVPKPLEKINFYGGLYMMVIGNSNMDFNMQKWLENNDDYADDNGPCGVNRPCMEEFVNPYNRYGWISCDNEEPGSVTDVYFPIKKIKKYTDERE